MSLTRWIQGSLDAWLKPSQRKFIRLVKMARVLAISHLPQVIAAADYQFYIEKISDEHSTVSTVVCSMRRTNRRNCQDAGRRGSNGSCPSTSRATSQALRERRFETMSRYFVVGDIHGKAQMLEEIMTEWDGKAQLVFLGDLIDRGENSKRSIEIVEDYVDHHGASLPFRNHEYMFLAWLDNPEER